MDRSANTGGNQQPGTAGLPAGPRQAAGGIVIISSHVARGSVGLRASSFALEALGYRVWEVPTVFLPFHPGHGPGERIIPPADQFGRLLDDLRNSPWRGEIAGVLTGYFADPRHARQAAAFIAALRRERGTSGPPLIHLCDPVMGDHGSLYVAEETAAAIRDHLVPGADWITPNRFELEWLSGMAMPDAAGVHAALEALGKPQAMVTSLEGEAPGSIGNLLACRSGSWFAGHRRFDHPPKGPGDLASALFLGHLLAGAQPQAILRDVSSSVLSVIEASVAAGSDEMILRMAGTRWPAPRAPVELRRLGAPGSKPGGEGE